MDTSLIARERTAWNVFKNRDPVSENRYDRGMSSSRSNHKNRLSGGNEKSIVSSVYTRSAIDVAALRFMHIRVDENENFIQKVNSGLNRCLNVEANIDQPKRAFIQDVVMSMFDEGSVAIVPVDTSVSLVNSGSFDILSMRTGKIVEWFPRHVRVQLYNDRTGIKEEITLPKSKVGIIENPLFAVMNEPNSTLQRLIRKLNLLDAIDEQSGSGKLDLIVQVPYGIKSDSLQKKAQQRRDDLEEQLNDSKYGVAYLDGTEKIIQLNRPAENNLMGQIEYLTRMLYSQLGMTESIFDGTADEVTLLNYYNRTIEPVASAITDELKRKFLTLTAQTQGQSIMHFRNMFGLITSTGLADLVDKLSRNEVVTGNEFRAVLGFTPSKDKGADELRNKNLNSADSTVPPEVKKEIK